MASVKEHYESHLSDYYSWLYGGFELKVSENRRFFQDQHVRPEHSGLAMDLGAGSGFQSVPLAELGFKVTAIDLSQKLLDELKKNAKGLIIDLIRDDLLNFANHCTANIELCVCMGDTLTHLNTRQEVQSLASKVYKTLEARGRFILAYRDLALELKELERFIPVRSDDQTIFTCFLEYETNHVKVHDLIYERMNQQWELKKSYFRKLRLSPQWTKDILLAAGFKIEIFDIYNGMVNIIARK
jgi:SAM-dependent methyltransferase